MNGWYGTGRVRHGLLLKQLSRRPQFRQWGTAWHRNSAAAEFAASGSGSRRVISGTVEAATRLHFLRRGCGMYRTADRSDLTRQTQDGTP